MGKFKVNLPARTKYNHYYDAEAAQAKYIAERETRKAKYEAEKILGTRQKNGAKNLKKLTRRHKAMISQILMGESYQKVAETFDVSYLCVYLLMHDPLVKPYLDQFDQAHREEFNRMLPKINEALHSGLDESSGFANQMKAIDRWTRVAGVLNKGSNEDLSVSKTEELHAARFKFVEMVREAAKKEGVIEAEAMVISVVNS